MNKLEKIAKRIGEIGEEVKDLELQRSIELQHCHASNETEFGQCREFLHPDLQDRENCLNVAFRLAKEEYEECFDRGESYSQEEFLHILTDEGCANCKAAYNLKRQIGKLKQERGRLVGNISKIGKSL